MQPPKSIREVRFRNRQKPGLEIEIIPVESLFRRKFSAVLESPERIHFYEILLFTGKHYVDLHEYAYDARTLFFVSAGQMQRYQLNLDAQGYIIVFTPEFIYRNATELNLFHSLQIFDHAIFSPRLQLDAEQHRVMTTLCEIIAHEYDKPVDQWSEEILRHVLRLLLMHAERIRHASALSQTVAPYYHEFVAFRQLVQRDLARSRQVNYYADQLAMSAKKLNDLTRRVLNKSAKDFIEGEVILETQRHLAQGAIPVKELAYQLGFSDPTNFVKFFKKHTGSSPADYRQNFLSPA